MGSTTVSTPPPPPAPTPIDPGVSAMNYTRSMADPELQRLLYESEATYRPQYAALNLADLNNYMFGTGGQMGALGLMDLAARQSGQTSADVTTMQRAADIADVEQLGGRASAAFRNANPELQAAMARAESLGGQQGGMFSEFERAATNPQQFGGIGFNPVQGVGFEAALGAPVKEATASTLGAAPTVSLGGYSAQNAQPIQSVFANRVGSGLLGNQLYGQALSAGGLGQVGSALQGRAAELAQSRGQLSPDEIRSLQQATREAYAARGTEMGSGAVSAEALSRLTNERGRMQEDLALAAQLNQAGQGELNANRAFQQSVQGADLSRQFSNAQSNLQAQLANQGAQGQMSLANQQAQNQAAQYGASAANQGQLANQGILGQYAMANQDALNRFALANQSVSLQQALADQQARQQAAQYGATAANNAALANQQADLAAQESNRNFYAQQAQQQLSNLGLLGQLRQGQLGADRGYSLQLAGMQQGIASDPFQAILGRPSQAINNAQFQQGYAGNMAQSMQGPQLFDPNAGINLAMQNNANLTNYNTSVYGSQMALAGAQAQAKGAMWGGLMSGLGAAGGGLLGNPKLF